MLKTTIQTALRFPSPPTNAKFLFPFRKIETNALALALPDHESASVASMRQPGHLLLVSAMIMLCSCGRCPALEQASISKDVYWPNRGPQRSSECHPERDYYRCVFVKPRCAKDDPRCGPMPMGKYDDCYDPTAERRPLSEPFWEPACTFDGECMVTHACNATLCTHYTLYPAGPEVCNQDSSID